MRLERKQDAEIARRKGSTRKTLIQIFWLGLNGVVAYLLINFLLVSDEVNFSYNRIYQMFFIPRSVPSWVLLTGMIIAFVLVMQIFLSLGFVFMSPEGRRKTGEGSLYSRNEEHSEERRY